MKDTVYVIVNKTGFVRALKREPDIVAPTERAFKLEIQIPDEAFSPTQLPTVRLNIPADQLYTPLNAELVHPQPDPIRRL